MANKTNVEAVAKHITPLENAHGDISVHRWFAEFERAAKLSGFTTDAKRLKLLSHCLVDEAEEGFERVPADDQNDYQAVKQFIINHLYSPTTYKRMQAQMAAVKQLPLESVQNYRTRFNRLVKEYDFAAMAEYKRAHPDAPENEVLAKQMDDSTKRMAFLEGLLVPYRGLCSILGIDTFDKLLEQAVTVEHSLVSTLSGQLLPRAPSSAAALAASQGLSAAAALSSVDSKRLPTAGLGMSTVRKVQRKTHGASDPLSSLVSAVAQTAPLPSPAPVQPSALPLYSAEALRSMSKDELSALLGEAVKTERKGAAERKRVRKQEPSTDDEEEERAAKRPSEKKRSRRQEPSSGDEVKGMRSGMTSLPSGSTGTSKRKA